MRWFRFYSDALDDPKVQRLPGDLFKTWVNLLCLANKSEERGTLPDIDDIAFALRLDTATAAAQLAELETRGLLDSGDDGLLPHNWASRQKASDDVTARVQQHRNKAKQPETLQQRSGNALDKTRVDTDQTRKEESRPEESVGAPPAPLRPLAQPLRPAPKRADARPTTPTVDDLCSQVERWADEKHVAPEVVRAEAEKFVNHCEAGKGGKPVVYANYARALQNWIMNPDYGPLARAPARASPSGHAFLHEKDARAASTLERVLARRAANGQP